MSSIGFVVPVSLGKEQSDREWMSALDGEKREEYRSEWKKAGFKHHTVWQQETPNGTVDIVYLEADDIPAAMQAVTSSDSPHPQKMHGGVVNGFVAKVLKADTTPRRIPLHWCRGRGSNPHGPLGPQDFKSCASASSATPALTGAEDGIRTRDPHLGKVVFYH